MGNSSCRTQISSWTIEIPKLFSNWYKQCLSLYVSWLPHIPHPAVLRIHVDPFLIRDHFRSLEMCGFSSCSHKILTPNLYQPETEINALSTSRTIAMLGTNQASHGYPWWPRTFFGDTQLHGGHPSHCPDLPRNHVAPGSPDAQVESLLYISVNAPGSTISTSHNSYRMVVSSIPGTKKHPTLYKSSELNGFTPGVRRVQPKLNRIAVTTSRAFANASSTDLSKDLESNCPHVARFKVRNPPLYKSA